MTEDPFELSRFVKAQNTIYAQVLGELREGRKSSHWMWFVFPQIAGLGTSALSQCYAISCLDEAKAFLRHDVLGPRLMECAGLVKLQQGRSATSILGAPDDIKLQASMTLFARAGGGEIFGAVLRGFFDGSEHAPTVRLLGHPSQTCPG